MGPFIAILAIAAGAYFLTLGKTVKTAKNLKYKINKIQIRKFNLLQPIVVRCTITFTNLENLPIILQQVYLVAYLAFQETGKEAKYTRFAELNNSKGYTIPANKTSDIYFDVEVRWRDLGSSILKLLQGVLTGGGVKLPSSVKLEGQITCEGFKLNVNEVVPLSNES